MIYLLGLSIIANVGLVVWLSRQAKEERASLLNRIQAPEREIYKPQSNGNPEHVSPFLDLDWQEYQEAKS